MDNFNPAPKKGSIIWRGVTSLTGGLYRAVSKSGLGRIMSGYRKADALLHHDRRRTLRDDCRPMSEARLRVVEAVRASRILQGSAGLFSLFAYAPAGFYGLFLLLFGLLSLPVYFFGPRLVSGLSFERSHLFLCAALVILGLTLLFSRQPTLRLLTTGRLTRWFFVGLLGFSEETVPPVAQGRASVVFKTLAPYLALAMALGCAAASLWLPPLLLPGILLLLAAAGMILAAPEAGVILAITVLPLILYRTDAVLLVSALILWTWLSYGIKLLLMHRAIHFNLIDVAVLIFSLAVCLSGMTGGYVTPESVLTGILCLILFSLFFLITNLMTDGKRLRRCLVGPLLTLAVVLVSKVISLAPAELWNFLAGSKGGDFLKTGLDGLFTAILGWSHPHDDSLIMMAIPFIFAMLFRRDRRLGYYIFHALLLGLSLVLLYVADAMGALLTAGVCLLLFLILLDHRAPAVGILALPVGICGGAWLTSLFPNALTSLLSRLAASQQHREYVWRGAWRMVCENPMGIGLGDRAFVSVYPAYAEVGYASVSSVSGLYMDLMVTMGLPGLFLCLVLIFLFYQKTFTCLRACQTQEHSVLLLGGMISLSTLLIYGLISDAPVYLPVMAVAITIWGVVNAFENLIFDRWDVSAARVVSDHSRAECVLHIK